MVTGFLRGFCLPLQALNLLMTRRRLKRYAVLPLVANVVLYVLAAALFIWLLTTWDLSVGEWAFLGPVGGWISTGLNWTLSALKWVVAIPVLVIVSYFTFTFMGMIIASPFNDMLSERVERALCDPTETPGLPLRLTVRNMWLSLLDSVVIVLMHLAALLLVLPLLAIPLVGFMPLFLVTAYFAGLGFYDIGMARNNLRRAHKAAGASVSRWEMLGLGVAMELLFFVPFAGLLLLPVGVTAGTLLYCGTDWDELLERRGLSRPEGFVAPVVRAEHAP